MYEGAVAPEAYVLDVVVNPNSAVPIDLTLVTSAVLMVRRPDGVDVEWDVTLSDQTATNLTLTHVFAAGEAVRGYFTIYAVMTTPAGPITSDSVTLPIRHRRSTSPR